MQLQAVSQSTQPSTPTPLMSESQIFTKTLSSSTSSSAFTSQEQIVEKAKQEAYVVQRINDLQKEGLWSEKRLPKVSFYPPNLFKLIAEF